MGSGEYLDTLVKLRGVENQSKAEFIASIRDSIAETISNDNYSKMTQIEKSEALYNIVYSQTQI
jgi:hypothetical protein